MIWWKGGVDASIIGQIKARVHRFCIVVERVCEKTGGILFSGYRNGIEEGIKDSDY